MSKALGIIAALLTFTTLTAEKASADPDAVRGWATSNGATWMPELEPSAQAVARGTTKLTLPQGSVSPWARGVFGFATLDEALASLGPAPTGGLVAAYAYADGATWNAGYVSVAEVVLTTVAPATIPASTATGATSKTPSPVVNEVSTTVAEATITTVAEVLTTSTVPTVEDDEFILNKAPTQVAVTVPNASNAEGVALTGTHTPTGASLPILPASLVILLIGGAALAQRKR